MFNFILDILTNSNTQFYLIGYFVGGIPFGLILANIFAKTNIRKDGSGSIGATNVLRVVKEKDPVLAKKLAIATVVLDALKGLLVIFVASLIGLSVATQWSIAVIVVLGHCFSPYLKFEGGKGVASAVGVMLWFLPIEVLISLVVWFILGKVVRISSVSSLGALIVFVISTYILHSQIPSIDTHAPIFIIAFIIIYKHIPNIVRLFEGKEQKVV